MNVSNSDCGLIFRPPDDMGFINGCEQGDFPHKVWQSWGKAFAIIKEVLPACENQLPSYWFNIAIDEIKLTPEMLDSCYSSVTINDIRKQKKKIRIYSLSISIAS